MTTIHALRRADSRMGISNTMAKNVIAKAEKQGLTSECFSGMERDFLERKERNGTKAIVYEGFCYIFSKKMICITVYRLPEWFEEKKNYNHKTEIRNLRSYYRHYPEITEDDWDDYCNAA